MKRPFGSSVLDVAARLLVPFMMLYALYVLFHGHYSPGGGFQGGVIFAAALTLLRLVWGERLSFGVGSQWTLLASCAGVLLFAGIGTLALLFGGRFLDYAVLPLGEDASSVRALGILGIEIGVGIAVTGVLILVFESLTADPE